MKYLRFILSLIIAMAAFSAFAGNPPKYFESLSGNQGFDYTYVSPLMLKAMGDTSLTGEFGNLPVKTSQISSIESITTAINGQDEDLWKIISSIKKDKKMDTLTTKKRDYYRYDVLAHLSNDGKYITHLLVVTQNGGPMVEVVYMEGKIPLDALSHSL